MSQKEAIEFIQKGICNLDRDERKEAYENFIQAITVLRAEEPPQGEISALIKTLEIYANTKHKVSQVFYQCLCIKAKEVLDRQAAEIEELKRGKDAETKDKP